MKFLVLEVTKSLLRVWQLCPANATGFEFDRALEVIGVTARTPTNRSLGYLELRYQDPDEFRELVAGPELAISGTDIVIDLAGIEDYQVATNYLSAQVTEMDTESCTENPQRCFIDYVFPQRVVSGYPPVNLDTSMLAEVAGANLIRRYVEFLQQWSFNPPIPIENPNYNQAQNNVLMWRLLDPIAFALHCQSNGSACANIGVGQSNSWVTDYPDRYDALIKHFRHVFGSDESRYILRMSEINQ
ncbi:MAG: hypothetical protein Phog2KO_28150 [Phototrophicaceae bacterium]